MKTVTKILLIILGILMVVTGIMCLFSPQDTYLMLGYVVGISMIFDAIGGFFEYGEVKGKVQGSGWILAAAIISLVFGFFVINSTALQLSLDVFIAYYVAAWLVLRGIIFIVHTCKRRKIHNDWNTQIIGTHFWLPLILGILIIVFGILCVFKPMITVTVIGVFMGIGIILSGGSMIALAVEGTE